MRNSWLFWLHRSPDSPNSWKKNINSFSLHSNSSSFFTHNYRLQSLIEVSKKNFLVSKSLSMILMSILFLALEFWRSVISINAIFNNSFWNWNPYFSVTRGLVPSILISAWAFVQVYWQIKLLIFPSHQNLVCSKILKLATTFDLIWHAKSSLTAITGFVPSTKVAVRNLLLLRIISPNSCPFRSLRLTSSSQKESGIIFCGVFSIF